MTEKMYSSSYFFFFGYEKCLSLLVPQWALSLCVSSSIASFVRSTHAALSPFQSQYFVVIAADCFQGGDHINTETCSYYVTLLSITHTLSRSVFLHPAISFFVDSSIHGDILIPLFVSLSPLFFSLSSLPSICFLWISTPVFHPLRLSLSLQQQAMNI